MQDNKAVLLHLPVPFATFARVKVPVPATGLSAVATSPKVAEAETLSVDAHTAKLHGLSNTAFSKKAFFVSFQIYFLWFCCSCTGSQAASNAGWCTTCTCLAEETKAGNP